MTEQVFKDGIDLLNRQAFYACHDTLEALWFEAMEPDKSLYQGILQVAVACYHLENLNLRGAVILLGEGLRRLRGGESVYEGWDLADFVAQGDRLLKQLQYLDPAQIEGFLAALRQEQGFPILYPYSAD